jgi:hypothetical protein
MSDGVKPRNSAECGQCDHFDPVLRGTKRTNWGWCAIKSIYPFNDSPGQVTPGGVKRVLGRDEPAEPKIVELKGIEPHCTLYKIKTKKPDKAALMAQALAIPSPSKIKK